MTEIVTQAARPPLPPFTRESASQAERLYRWSHGRRPNDHPGLSDLGL
jgi:nuclear transport factor 2 (NTF2) superfamily protein